MAIGKAVASEGIRQASFEKLISYARRFLSAGGHTLFEYPLMKTLEVKLRKEYIKSKVTVFESPQNYGKASTRYSKHVLQTYGIKSPHICG